MKRLLPIMSLAALAACSTTVTEEGTLATLQTVEPDLNEVHLEDSLERAEYHSDKYIKQAGN